MLFHCIILILNKKFKKIFKNIIIYIKQKLGIVTITQRFKTVHISELYKINNACIELKIAAQWTIHLKLDCRRVKNSVSLDNTITPLKKETEY